MAEFELLSTLLAPVPVEDFLACFRNRTHLHVSGRESDHFAPVLTLAHIDGMLELGALPAATINVVTHGTKISMEEWTATLTSTRGAALVTKPDKLMGLFAKGATIILNKSRESIPTLGDACRRLMYECGVKIGANIYITPSGGQGFDAHGDTHDVLVLQVHGNKFWTIYPQDAEPLPIELQAGDLLYIPRMLRHEARCGDTASVHVTISLTPAYGFDLIEQLAKVAETDPLFQAPAPSKLAGPEERAAFEATFAGLVGQLAERVGPRELVRLHDRKVAMEQRPCWPGRLTDTILAKDLRLESLVGRRPGILVDVSDNGSAQHVCFAGVEIDIPHFLAPSLQQVLGETPFRIGELVGLLSKTGKVELVRQFVDAGLLSILEV